MGAPDAGEVLDCARDAYAHQQLWCDREAGLPHLAAVLAPAGLHERAAAAELGAEQFGQVLHERQVLLGPDAAAHDHEHLGVGDGVVVACRLAFDHAHGRQVVGGQARLGAQARAVRVGLGGRQYAGAYRGHLGTAVGAHDRGHEVAAKGRARLVEKPRLGVDLEHGAVGGEAGLQPGRHRGCQLTAKARGPEQQDLGGALGGQAADPAGVDVGVRRGEPLVAAEDHLVGAAGDQLADWVGVQGRLVCGPRAVAQAQQRDHAAAAGVGKLARLTEQLEHHRGHGTVGLLGKDPDVGGLQGLLRCGV